MKTYRLILIFLLLLPSSIFSQEEKGDSIKFSLGWNVGDCWVVGVYGFMENRKKFYNSYHQRDFQSIIEISVNDKWIEKEDTVYLIEFMGNYKAFWTVLSGVAGANPKDAMYSLEYSLHINADGKKSKDGKVYRIDEDGRKHIKNISDGYIGEIYQHHGKSEFSYLPIMIFPHFDKDHLYYRRSTLVNSKDEADWCASYIPQKDTTVFHFQRRSGLGVDFFDDIKQYWAPGSKFWSRYIWYTGDLMSPRKIEFPALEAVLLAEHLAD